MNRVQRTALLAFFLLLLMALAGWFFGGKKSKPTDAAPDVMALDISQTKTIWLLPEEQRKSYVSADRFRAQPVADPYRLNDGRAPGGEVASNRSKQNNLKSPPTLQGNPQSPKPNSARYIRVRQGQTPSHIALEELGDASRWKELLAYNTLPPDAVIKPGQLLYLPNPEGPTATVTSTLSVEIANASAVRHHKVLRGEYLGGISSRYYGTSKETARILTANNLSNADQIRAGQVLIIPPRN